MSTREGPPAPSKAERRAARAAVGAYHKAELGRLIEHVRGALDRYDVGEVDAFELDDLIHHYRRATQKLWSFRTGSGGQVATHRRVRSLAPHPDSPAPFRHREE
jgi:hypothetical protein